MALPSSPVNGQYVRPSDDVLYKYNESDNSYRTFNAKNGYVKSAEYSYRFKNAGGNITAPYLDTDDSLIIEISYSFKQEIYTPSNIGGNFTMTLPESISSSGGVPTAEGSVLVREVDATSWTISSSLNIGRWLLGGVGTQSAALAFGGGRDAQPIEASTEKFDGNSWTINGAWDLGSVKRGMGSAGIQNAALSFGGTSDGTTDLAITEKFDGSSWTTNGAWDLNTARDNLAGTGIQSAALSFGGITTGSVNNTEKFDGSSWSNTGNLNTARFYLAGAGIQNAALSFGGSSGYLATTEKFDGSSWSTTGSLNTGRSSLAGAGEQNTALSFGGLTSSNVSAVTEKFNGSSWSLDSGWGLNVPRQRLAGAGEQTAALSFGGRLSSVHTPSTEKFIQKTNIVGLYNKGQNNVDYSFGADVTISGDQLVIAAGALDSFVSPTIEVSYLPSAREREGISIFADFDIKNLGDAPEEIEIVRLYNSIDPNHYAIISYDKSTTFYTINYSNYDSSIDSYSTGSVIGSTVRNLSNEIIEFRIKDFFDTFWSTNLDLYADREESTDVTNNASPDNLFYDTIEALSGAQFIVGDIVVSYGDSSRIDVLSEEVNYKQNQPDVYYELKEYGEYIFDSLSAVDYTITNTGNILDGYWAVGADLNTARRYLAGAGTQNAALSFGGFDGSYSAVTEKFDGSSWSNTGSLNTARYGLAGAGEQNAALSFGGFTGSDSAVTEKFDGSSWSTQAGWDLNTARQSLAGAGEQNAALSFGGYNGSYLAITEKFDGSSWSNTGSLNTAREGLAGAGTQNAALSFGGWFTGNPLATTEKFDGSSWSTQSGWDLNTARSTLAGAGAGTQNAALSFGGFGGSLSAVTEKFDGSSWTVTGSLNTARNYLAGAGTQNAALSFGGFVGSLSAVTEKFQNENSIRVIRGNNIDIVDDEINLQDASATIQVIRNNSFSGGTWTATGSLNTARRYLAGAGTQKAALSFGGYDGSVLATTEKFDGSSWSTQSGWDLNTARNNLAGTGTQNAALAFGGYVSGYSAVTEKFDGSNWATTGSMNIAREGLAGAGEQNAALSFGGVLGSPLATTEKFDGSSWTYTANMNTARIYLAGAGEQNAALSFGGAVGPSVATTEKFDGSSWSTTGGLNTARQYLAGAGEQNVALSFGGYVSGYSAVTEKFNGTFWTTTGSLNTARRRLAGAGTQSASLAFAGDDGSYSAATEKFDYTPEVIAALKY